MCVFTGTGCFPVCVYVRVQLYKCVSVCLCVCVCACMRVCVHVWNVNICMSAPVCVFLLSHARGNQRTERMMSMEAGDMFSPRYPIQGKGKDVVPASEL